MVTRCKSLSMKMGRSISERWAGPAARVPTSSPSRSPFAPRGSTPRPTSYYRAEHGDWTLIVLNSLLALDGRGLQVRWLERELARAPSACLLAIWHHPLRSSAFHGRMPWDRGRDTDVFWTPLLTHGADIILNGHDHLYERFARADTDGRASSTGIRQFTVGTGGAELHRALGRRPLSRAAVDDTYGVLVLWLQPSGYEWAFIGTDGRIRDASETPTPCR